MRDLAGEGCRAAEDDERRTRFGIDGANRRAAIEQAKGILMSRNDMSADQAFESLRDQSGRTGSKIHEVAAAVLFLLSPAAMFISGTRMRSKPLRSSPRFSGSGLK